MLNVRLGVWLVYPELVIGRPALPAGSERTSDCSWKRSVGLAPAIAPGRDTRLAKVVPLLPLSSVTCFVSFVFYRMSNRLLGKKMARISTVTLEGSSPSMN
jgi:hypothetical protein